MRSLSLLLLLAVAAPAAAQDPAPPPADPAAGVVGQSPIAAGNTASARERALDEAFRQLVERAFADLLAELGVTAPTPAQAAVRASWLQRPRRLVRGFRVLGESEQGGVLSVRVSADLDQAGMRRELERARGGAGPVRGAPAGALAVVALGGSDVAPALAAALSGKGVRAEHVAGRFADDNAVRPLAQRTGRVALAVASNDQDEGIVRGTSVRAHGCEITVRLVPAEGSVSDRSIKARGFDAQTRAARASCQARAIAALLPTLLPEVGGPGGTSDLRTVILELDLTEPAALAPLLRAIRKVAGPAAAEVRRVAVGRVELAANTRLAAPALLAGITREVASVATITRTGAGGSDRIAAQVRLVPPTVQGPAPPPAPIGPALPPGSAPR